MRMLRCFSSMSPHSSPVPKCRRPPLQPWLADAWSASRPGAPVGWLSAISCAESSPALSLNSSHGNWMVDARLHAADAVGLPALAELALRHWLRSAERHEPLSGHLGSIRSKPSSRKLSHCPWRVPVPYRMFFLSREALAALQASGFEPHPWSQALTAMPHALAEGDAALDFTRGWQRHVSRATDYRHLAIPCDFGGP